MKAERESTWFVSDVFFFPADFYAPEESEKRCRDECCAVSPAPPEGPPLLIKGPKEDKKQRLSMIFPKKKTAKVERLVEGWWRDY